MKYIIVLLASLMLASCAALSIKCPVGALPLSPTHEELIKQEKHNNLVASLEKKTQRHFETTLEMLKQQELTDVHLTLVSLTVIDGSSEPLGVVEATLTNCSRKVGYMYFVFLYFDNDWQITDAIPVHVEDKEGTKP
jgi:hypothetical protein